MYSCTKIISFCASHRLENHEGECKNFHGHNYKAEIHLSSRVLDSVGRVVDFSIIKKLIGDWINENWDHACLLCSKDKFLETIDSEKFKIFTFISNPTAEIMANYLYTVVYEKLNSSNYDLSVVRIDKIVIWESDTAYVTYTPTI